MAYTLGPACDDTHNTSSIVQPLLHVRSVDTDCGHPSAEPKFHNRNDDARTNPSTHERACPGGPQPGSKSTAAEMDTRGSDAARACSTMRAHVAPPKNPLCAVTEPELLVPIDTSHGPTPHSANPAAHAAAVAAMLLYGIVRPNPFDPPSTCFPNESTTIPRGTFFAWSHAAARMTGTAVSIGVTS